MAPSNSILRGVRTLADYGLLFATTKAYLPEIDIGQELGRALGSVSDDQSVPLIQDQLRDDYADMRRNGMKGLGRLLEEDPRTHLRLQFEIRNHPILAWEFAQHAWQNQPWLRTADTIMGVLESLPQVDAQQFKQVPELLTYMAVDFNRRSPAQETLKAMYSAAIGQVLHNLPLREMVISEERWNQALPFLFMYWISDSFAHRTTHNNIQSTVKKLLIARRALRRFEQYGDAYQAPQEFARAKEMVDDLFFHPDGSVRMQADQRKYTFVLKYIGEHSFPRDPLVPLGTDEQGHHVSAYLERWLSGVFQHKEARDCHKPEMGRLARINELREIALREGRVDEFVEALLKSGGRLKEGIAILENGVIVDRLKIEKPRKSRMVIWNPYQIDDDVVIHKDLGEGRVVKAADESGMVTVKLDGRSTPIRVYESSIVSARDRKAYIRVLKGRAERYVDKAVFFGALALYGNLAQTDPVFHLMSEKLFTGRSREKQVNYILGQKKISGEERDDVWLATRWIGQLLGFDHIRWSCLLASGRYPDEVLVNQINKARRNTMRQRLSNDLVRGFVWFRPWEFLWRGARSMTIQSAGNYYPTYYKGRRNNDLTRHYFSYRDGSPVALDIVVELMRPIVDDWVARHSNVGETLLVPMIGTAPNQKLAERLGHPFIFPWQPRPKDYGEGVEGKKLFQKMDMVTQALKLYLEAAKEIEGRSVLVLDDNATDHATWIVARKLLFEAGAADVNLAVLTRTVRRTSDLGVALP